MDHVRQAYPDGGVLIDGSGADICFGQGDRSMRIVRKWAHRSPAFARHIGRAIYNNFGLYKSQSKIGYILAMMANSNTPKSLFSPISCNITSFFNDEIVSDTHEVDDAFLKICDACISDKPYNELPQVKSTVVNLLIFTALTARKSFRVWSGSQIHIICPYVWKDVLIEQGKLSWKCKVNNGITKWPIKKLLEEYMPAEFVYRKKAGFQRGSYQWLRQEGVYHLLQDVIGNPNSLVSGVIERHNVKKMLDDLPRHKDPSPSVANFLWGALFTEMWLRKNI
jgi:asparagine synthetase B (glutamine-hydrolysing)